ncbi:MAG: AI-2E family transporter [Lachnospiraceae bacterium]|nr:AI-2E family transporter [Lachnospiraceae bacterium]
MKACETCLPTEKALEMVNDVMYQIEKKEYKAIIQKIAVIIGTYLGMKYLLPLMFPFVIAFFAVSMLYKPIDKIAANTHLNRQILTGSILILILLPFLALLLLFCGQVLGRLGNMIGHMGMIQREISCQIGVCCEYLESRLGIQADDMQYFILDKIGICVKNLQDQIPQVMGRSMNYLLCLASVMAGVAITFVAIILLMKDYKGMKSKIEKSPAVSELYQVIGKVGHLLFVFLRAQLIIMLVITLLTGAGFYVLGVKNAIILALITSFLDLLPFIGTGIILAPLALWNLFQGRFLPAAGLIILYVLCTLARQFMEPKLIGEKLGIYPIGILFAIYVGIKLYGISGIMLGPISLLLIMEIWKIID